MIDESLAPGSRPTLEGRQFAPERRVIEDVDAALGEQRLNFLVSQALVQIARLVDVAPGGEHRGLLVPDPLSPKTFAHSARRVTVPVDDSQVVALEDRRDLADDPFEIDRLLARA